MPEAETSNGFWMSTVVVTVLPVPVPLEVVTVWVVAVAERVKAVVAASPGDLRESNPAFAFLAAVAATCRTALVKALLSIWALTAAS